jgi:hypothetical protein
VVCFSRRSLFIVLWMHSQLLFQETRPGIQTIIIFNVAFRDLQRGSPKSSLNHYSWPHQSNQDNRDCDSMAQIMYLDSRPRLCLSFVFLLVHEPTEMYLLLDHPGSSFEFMLRSES